MNVNPKAYENYHKQPTAHPESVCAICGQDDTPLPVAHFHVIAGKIVKLSLADEANHRASYETT